MLLAEHLGERMDDYHVKIYGTDVDEGGLVNKCVNEIRRLPSFRLGSLHARR